MGCDSGFNATGESDIRFQSTHPRGVRLPESRLVWAVQEVSIHAPAWGATYSAIFSIVDSGVSIHAPAWGATQWKKLQGRFPTGFNPRTRVGCDPVWPAMPMPGTGFQSTHPRGVRHAGRSRSGWWLCSFNPRTRVGCDAGKLTGGPVTNVFQSTHPRGVRRSWTARASRSRMFQSTHPRGVRPPTRSCARPLWTGFNPRTRVGCDEDESQLAGVLSHGFNPRTRVGCDLNASSTGASPRMFQSTHPRGVRLFPCFIQ